MNDGIMHKIALVACVEQYAGIDALPSAAAGAGAFADAIGRASFEVEALSGEAFSLDAMNAYLEEVDDKDLHLIVYFAGRILARDLGGGHSMDYLALPETDPQNLAETALALDQIVFALGQMQADQILFIVEGCAPDCLFAPGEEDLLAGERARMVMLGASPLDEGDEVPPFTGALVDSLSAALESGTRLDAAGWWLDVEGRLRKQGTASPRLAHTVESTGACFEVLEGKPRPEDDMIQMYGAGLNALQDEHWSEAAILLASLKMPDARQMMQQAKDALAENFEMQLLERAEGFSILALRAFEDDNVEKAEALWKSALDYLPTYQPAHDGLLQIRERRDPILRVEGLIGRAQKAANADDFDAAEAMLNEVLEIEPDNDRAHAALERLAAQKANFEKRKAAAEIVSLKKDAKAALLRGNFIHARELYERVLALTPGDLAAEAGLSEIDRRMQMAPQMTRALEIHQQAQEAAKAEDWEKAEALWHEVLEIQPNYAPANAGLEDIEQHRLEAERKAQEKASREKAAQARQKLESGDLSGAEALFREAAGMWPQNSEVEAGLKAIEERRAAQEEKHRQEERAQEIQKRRILIGAVVAAVIVIAVILMLVAASGG